MLAGRSSRTAYLVKFSWTDIVDTTSVKCGRASPDDPALTEYWTRRRQRLKSPLDGNTLRLLTKQAGRCPLRRDELLSPEQPPHSRGIWERWWLHVTRRAIVADYLSPTTGDPAHRMMTTPASCAPGATASTARAGVATRSFNPEPPPGLA